MNMRFTNNYFYLFILLLISTSGCAQDQLSKKEFAPIALTNKIDFVESKFDQSRFSCGFLIKYNADTFAVTAKHLLKIIKTDQMKTLTFENYVKDWMLYPLDKKEQVVVTDKLLNENKSELLDNSSTYNQDWLLFSIKANHSNVKPLAFRTTPLTPGEKLYVIGWTRKMETGSQRVYEFEYYKSIGDRLLLKDVIVPEQFGGLSGAPVVDEQGLVVGIVSGGTVDPDTKKKYFSPCTIDGLMKFMANLSKK